MNTKMLGYLSLVGIASVAFGLWQIYQPLMWLFVGVVLVVLAIAIHRQNQKGVIG